MKHSPGSPLSARVLCASVAGTLLGFSPAMARSAEAASARPTQSTETCRDTSDADIFYAVFFGKGRAVSKLPKSYTDARATLLESERKKSTTTQLRALKRTKAKLDKEGKTEDAKLVQQAIQYYDGLKDRKSGSKGAASTETAHSAFLKAFNKRFPGEIERFGSQMRSGNPALVRSAMRSMATKAMTVAQLTGTGPSAGADPHPEEDSNIALVALTFIVIFVILALALPLTSDTGQGLREDQLAGLMAKAFKC
jgi:hypothetical protein